MLQHKNIQKEFNDLLWHNMLKSVSVFVLHGRYDNLYPFPPWSFQSQQGHRCRLSPLRQEDDEGQRLQRFFQKSLEVRDGRVHQLLAKWRICLKAATLRLEIQNGSVIKNLRNAMTGHVLIEQELNKNMTSLKIICFSNRLYGHFTKATID